VRSRFLRSRHLLGYRRSIFLRCNGDSWRVRFSFFLFRFVNLNHLAGLKLIRKIRRSRLLCLRRVRTGEANASAHSDDAHGAGGHVENVLAVSGRSTYGFVIQNDGRLVLRHAELLELVLKTKNYFVRVSETAFSLMLLVTSTDITVWVVSALLALGIGLSKYAKWKARNQLVRELAAMDRERREKVLSRMNPAQAMEARQELMRRFNIF